MMSDENKNKKKKFIVLDVVFYGSSLNYDQGAGNFQELKKITKWDGKQYTFVSRYALRYSLLKTGAQLGLWKLAGGNLFERSGDSKTVIQPSIRPLLSGEILKYPEFNFFGYLITGTKPQNSREAVVKLSPAISMTPYNYDTHFSGNLDLARRMVESGNAEKMDTNLFTQEEHMTFYVYSVLIDVDRLCINDVFLTKNSKVKLDENEIEINNLSIENNVLTIDGNSIKIDEKVEADSNKLNDKIFKISQKLKIDKKILVKNLIEAIFNLNRDIKARRETLHPKLLVLGLYTGKYESYKDKITLADSYEETFEEEKKEINGKVKIIRRVVKLTKPVFEIASEKILYKSRNNILEEIEKFLEEKSEGGVFCYKSSEVNLKFTYD